MLREFKEFAMRGNVFDLAIAVVLGTAFNQIVSSLVEDMIMPLVGLIIGGIDFGSLQIVFGDAVIHYGVFIQSIVDFVLIAFSIFLFIKLFNKFKRKEEKKEEVKAPTLTKEEVLLTEIRDLLKTQSKRK